MTKVVLIFWVLTDAGHITDPQRIDGWHSMDECVVAAESFTESNPKAQNTHKYAIIAECVEVPR